jgi:aspartate carbamoyltransferase regulatory subunit
MDKIIGYISEGIVIDHIPVGGVWQIAKILGVDKDEHGRISLGDGFESSKIEKKGIIKIENAKVSEDQLNLIALVAENASVTFIESGRIVKKINAKIPYLLESVIVCKNVNCISNDDHEKVKSRILFNHEEFKCYYCDTEFSKEEIEFVE